MEDEGSQKSDTFWVFETSLGDRFELSHHQKEDGVSWEADSRDQLRLAVLSQREPAVFPSGWVIPSGQPSQQLPHPLSARAPLLLDSHPVRADSPSKPRLDPSPPPLLLGLQGSRLLENPIHTAVRGKSIRSY